MKINLSFGKKKHLVRQSLLLLQLEMWKNELTLYEGFDEFIKKNKIEFPPSIGSAKIVFKTVAIVDPELFEKIKTMKMVDGLGEIVRKWGADDTGEEDDEFVVPGEIRKIEIPANIEDIQQKLESKKPITAEDVIQPNRPDRKLDDKADFKVVKGGVFEKPKLKKNE